MQIQFFWEQLHYYHILHGYLFYSVSFLSFTHFAPATTIVRIAFIDIWNRHWRSSWS